MKISKEWYIVLILVILTLILVFRNDLVLSPKEKTKILETKSDLKEIGGLALKDPNTQEAQSLFNRFFIDKNE